MIKLLKQWWRTTTAFDKFLPHYIGGGDSVFLSNINYLNI